MSSEVNQSLPLSPDYRFVFSFEKNFNYKDGHQWFYENWSKTGFPLIIVYIILVFSLQNWMKERKAFKLKLPLVLWNLSLALFSIMGALRTVPELLHVLRAFGFTYSVCNNSYHKHVPISSFWTFLFICSKAPELGDTLFVVLRKQKLIFLHWYHHVTVLLFTWQAYADESSAGRWYIDMNYCVHALMYSYYALRAIGVRVPRVVAMLITCSQITQMLIGCYVTCYALVVKQHKAPCSISLDVIYCGILMYFSYFVLFANFFRNSYFKRENKKIKSN